MVRNAFVLSDIHLGASTSLLTAMDYDPVRCTLIDRPMAKTLLDMLIQDLKQMTFGEKIQQCILLGDIFELSFAPYGLAMQNGRWFFETLVAADIFEEFVYVPGNHDHHLWQQLSEHYYLMTALDAPPLDYPRTLPANVLLDNTFLDGLLPEGHGLQVTYPNYELWIADKPFYLHHGHYLQKLYIAASDFLAEIIHTRNIEDLEVLNAPFLEFGWYNIGQAYNIGHQKLIDQLYYMYKNHDTRRIDRLLKLFLRKINRWDTTARRKRWNLPGMLMDTLIQALGPYLLRRLFFKHSRLFKKHRHASSSRHKRLGGSLDMAIQNYLAKYLLPESPQFKACTFIFGHTHEPEDNYQCYDARQICYHIYNTGGWVADTVDASGGWVMPRMSPLYLAEDGSVYPLPFTQTHADYLRTQLSTDPGFQQVKAEQFMR